MKNKFQNENSSKEFAELDNLINSFELEELEERIELGCFGGCQSTGYGVCLWSS
jgi:hypothetical protein